MLGKAEKEQKGKLVVWEPSPALLIVDFVEPRGWKLTLSALSVDISVSGNVYPTKRL